MSVDTAAHRPTCPDCGREMVYLVTNCGPDVLSCYICDCKNEFLAREVQECRRDASPDASIAMTTEMYAEEEPIPRLPPGLAHHGLEFYCPN